MIFLFIFIVFYFCHPYNLFWSTENISSLQETEDLLYVTTGSIVRKIALVALGLFAVCLILFTKKRDLVHFWALSFVVIFFICWAWMSLLWSGDASFTFRRLTVLSVLWLSATCFGYYLSLREIVKLIVFIGLTTLLISITSEIISGLFHPLVFDYRFAGVMHPNAQAINCGLLLVALVCLYKLTFSVSRWWYICLALMALTFLILTKSRTGLIAALIANAFFLIITLKKRKRALILSLICFLSSLLGLLGFFILDEQALGSIRNIILLGRVTDIATFTGRVPMWMTLITYIAQRPILGYGYNSFWTAERMSDIMISEGSWAASAHSSYINIALGLGLIGLMNFLLILFFAFLRSMLLFKKRQDVTLIFSAASILLVCISMVFETIWFQPYIFSFLGMIILAKICVL